MAGVLDLLTLLPAGKPSILHSPVEVGSVFRFCDVVHEVIAIVISQDRQVRLVKWKDGMVTYWDLVATNIMDF